MRLVTTALKETQPTNSREKVVFLGQWCLKFSYLQKNSNLNPIVIPYHWDNRNKLKKDYYYINKVYEENLLELSNKLNNIHNVKKPVRYWRILIGPWLGYFHHIIFDRWSMINYAFNNYPITKIKIFKFNNSKYPPNDMNQFLNLYLDDHWNEMIFGQLIENMIPMDIKITFADKPKLSIEKDKKSSNSLFKIISFFPRLLNKKIKKDDKYFFFDTPLSYSLEKDIILRINHKYTNWDKISLKTFKYKKNKRNFFKNENDLRYESIIKKLIPLNIPKSYLEGYSYLINKLKKINWPSNPKIIFTGTAFLNDDLFKVYTAEKIVKSTKFYIGQHGGNYGSSNFYFDEEHEIKISDSWFSWGWNKSEVENVKPLFNLKNTGLKIKHNPNGNLLMVGMTLPRYSYHLYSVPIAGQWLNYFNEQCTFIDSLPNKIKSKLLLRLSKNDWGWEQSKRYKAFYPDINLDNGNNSIYPLLQNCKIYISTYNATTFLESFYFNIPTIIFWNPKYWELRKEFTPFEKRLIEAGILFYNPLKACAKLIEIWDHVETWWGSQKIQEVRKFFCSNYSNKVRNPAQHLIEYF